MLLFFQKSNTTLRVFKLLEKKSYFDSDFTIAAIFEDYSEKEVELYKTLSSIRSSCGDVCDTTIRGKPGKVRVLDTLFSTVYVLRERSSRSGCPIE